MAAKFSKEYQDKAKTQAEALIKLTIHKGGMPAEVTPENFKGLKQIELQGTFRPELVEKAVDFFHYLLGDNKKPEWMK